MNNVEASLRRRRPWPPTGDKVMDVFGFQESLATPDQVLLPGNVNIRLYVCRRLRF